MIPDFPAHYLTLDFIRVMVVKFTFKFNETFKIFKFNSILKLDFIFDLFLSCLFYYFLNYFVFKIQSKRFQTPSNLFSFTYNSYQSSSYSFFSQANA